MCIRDSDDVSSVTTYQKSLRGFERIHLKAGEETTVRFTLRPRDLSLWNKHEEFVVEPGTFTIMVGRSSEDICLHGKLTVDAYHASSEDKPAAKADLLGY